MVFFPLMRVLNECSGLNSQAISPTLVKVECFHCQCLSLVEVLVSLLQVQQDLLSALDRRGSRDAVLGGLQQLPEERLQLRLVLHRELRHCLCLMLRSQ